MNMAAIAAEIAKTALLLVNSWPFNRIIATVDMPKVIQCQPIIQQNMTAGVACGFASNRP